MEAIELWTILADVPMSGRDRFAHAVAYWIAFATVVTVVPALLFWLLVHPFIGFWRKVGPAVTYVVVVALLLPVAVVLFLYREPILAVRFRINWPMVLASWALVALAVYIGFRLRRQLPVSVMFGVPELRPGARCGRLLDQGIYASIRHPRYVEVAVMLTAAALYCNYLATWLVLALYVVSFYGVVLLEERELRERFGKEYDEYCRRVPRFIPRLGRARDGG